MAERRQLAVAIAGLGSVGLKVARALDAGIDGLRLAAVAASSPESARKRIAEFKSSPAVVTLDELADHGDIVVECLPPDCFRAVALSALERDRILIAASVGGLLENPDIVERARTGSGRIIAPSGAIAGVDALSAAREAGLQSVKLVSTKPPKAFGEAGDGIVEPTTIFEGSAREAVKRFPKNINVAATVSLAGLGPDRTIIEIRADPAASANRHELQIVSGAGEAVMTSVNLPDPDNPKSSAITGYSIIAALRRLADPLSIGS